MRTRTRVSKEKKATAIIGQLGKLGMFEQTSVSPLFPSPRMNNPFIDSKSQKTPSIKCKFYRLVNHFRLPPDTLIFKAGLCHFFRLLVIKSADLQGSSKLRTNALKFFESSERVVPDCPHPAFCTIRMDTIIIERSFKTYLTAAEWKK